jgi:hypothetical protein
MSDFTVAVSERTFRELFEVVRDNIAESTSDSADFGLYTLNWNLGFRLENGTVDLQSDNSVLVSELDMVYDPVHLTFGVDIEKICIGGFCIIPTPFGCALRVPEICVFSADPDIQVPIDLSGLIRSEISGAFRVNTRYFVDPGRTSSMTNLDAEDAKVPNKYQFLLDPIQLDIDPLDIADMVGNILDQAIENAMDNLLGGLPGWVKDVIKAMLGPVVDLVRAILDIADDFDEWLSNLLGPILGVLDFVRIIADYFANRYPIFEVEDPYPIMKYDGALIPVKVPLLNMAVNVNDDEMILQADVGI